MSTVVVVRKNGRACIAADSLTSWGSTKMNAAHLANNSKIVQVGDTYIGITGATTHKFVIQNYFSKCEEYSFNGKLDIFETWLKFHKVLKEEYHLNPKENDDDPYETSQMNVLLANPHGIFGIYALRSVDEFSRFWAFGSGTDYALGALFTCYDQFDNPEDIARAAINAAAEFDNASALPIVIYSVELIQ